MPLKDWENSQIGLNCLGFDNKDSDNDGVPDGDEIKISSVPIRLVFPNRNDLPNGDYYYVSLYSNPCIKDSDGDGLNDLDEYEKQEEPDGSYSYKPIVPLIPAPGLPIKPKDGDNWQITYHKQKPGGLKIDAAQTHTLSRGRQFLEESPLWVLDLNIPGCGDKGREVIAILPGIIKKYSE